MKVTFRPDGSYKCVGAPAPGAMLTATVEGQEVSAGTLWELAAIVGPLLSEDTELEVATS